MLYIKVIKVNSKPAKQFIFIKPRRPGTDMKTLLGSSGTGIRKSLNFLSFILKKLPGYLAVCTFPLVVCFSELT
ncbi:MAG: hypothetical protein CSA44_01220 [Gammaproteobacteria bacterium]|nr:MAG: hypothetical protein CSA44_01220 [Gammaproteobacteria bacterium]